MATVREQHSGVIWEGEEAAQYLDRHGVLYEAWDMSQLEPELRGQPNPSLDEQTRILEHFRPGLQRLARERGYVSHDMIVLNRDAQPNLADLLVKFEREHHHTEDEVRFTVYGEGIFTLTRGQDTFSVTVRAGDLISVPAGTRHFFTLTERREIVAIRLFMTRDGWVAIYDPAEARQS